ncbi:glycoside hydrolase family 32 protein [Phycomyces blakesleeanus]
MKIDYNKLFLPLGLISVVMLKETNAIPFESIKASLGKIETGYGADNTTFTANRPKYHFQGPVNWMNDPSAPWHDGEYYHIYYQHNPYSAEWGNMTWGHAVSKDMIQWIDKPLAIYPDQPFDIEGAFDGTILENGYQNKTTMLYTGVSHVPLGWRLPYTVGAEKQVLAYTEDNGDSWVKVGPVITAPPKGLNVTGFRDPYLFRSSKLDTLLNIKDPNSIYTTVSSGIQQDGPRLWLYQSNDWENWNFHGPMIAAPENFTRNLEYSSRLGYNFETASYVEMPTTSTKDEWTLVTLGVEGGRLIHDLHSAVWTLGRSFELLSPDGKEVQRLTPGLNQEMTGMLDWGNYYAAVSWKDPKNPDRVLLTGWIPEDIVPVTVNGVTNENNRNSQGWAGMFGLNRELEVIEIKNVSVSDPLVAIENASWVATTPDQDSKTVTVSTLAIRPMEEYKSLRKDCSLWSLKNHHSTASAIRKHKRNRVSIPGVSTRYAEIVAEFEFHEQSAPFGLSILESSEGQRHEETLIVYDPKQSKIDIDRSRSSLSRSPGYPNSTETGPLPLFKIGSKNGKVEIETLKLRVFIDNTVVEVYANDRFALSSRVYPTLSKSAGISVLVTKDVGVKQLDIYQNIDVKAFDRP